MFDLQFDDGSVHLRKSKAKGAFANLRQIFGSQHNARDLTHLAVSERELIIALADLRALADEHQAAVEIGTNDIRMPHLLVAALSSQASETLGLPRLVDMALRTDAEGIVGSPKFRLRAEWFKNGQRQMPRRTGSILETSDGLRRLPLWMMEALDVADGFSPGGTDVDHWAALSRFRRALDPGVRMGDPDQVARSSMTDFLSGLQVRVADRFSVAANADGDDFEVLPFSGLELKQKRENELVAEADAEISDMDLRNFQEKVRQRGSLSAYRLGPGSFLVIDRAALPALEVMAEMQQAPARERAAFVKNPRLRITEAVEGVLRREGKLDGLSPEAEEEAIETVAGPVFVETREFSERVTGVKLFEKLDIEIAPSGTTWLPEQFARQLAEALARRSAPELETLRDDVQQAIDKGEASVPLDDINLPAKSETLATIDAHIATRFDRPADSKAPAKQEHSGPIVLDGKSNFDEVEWASKFTPRQAKAPILLSGSIKTPMKLHQLESFKWQVAAWQAGLPGILNADEQGLGKTLQTISFLVWLKSHMAHEGAEQRGPVLVVAPTSLLENWEQEVSRHVGEPGLGHLIRLFGSATGTRKMVGKAGKDIENGEAKLDLSFLTEAVEEGRAHRFWILTTYTTLTNYQHSLGRIPFSSIVFDEIQNLKNPTSLRAQAAMFMKADFRIGLTGTPIENSAVDLWAIMEQLAPGALDSLKEFRRRYAAPNATNMADLHERVFIEAQGRPPLALRRTKDQAAKDLPEKTRYLHPRVMPAAQASAYDDARLKLAQGGLGAALKMLHHIRSVSVHPSIDAELPATDFIGASARLQATFEVLRRIAAKRERALVFIEHRQMQYRFIELARAEFGLDRIDLINGDTPIPQRQAIVNRFQLHLQNNGGFDLLVLGPKAAGVGLTLTAATHVIHLSRWWNPAVEEQCNDRVHRIGQTLPVSIHAPMAVHPGYRENSFDCLLHSLMNRKRKLAKSALWPMGDTEGDVAELHKMLNADKQECSGDPLHSALAAMFIRDSQTFSAIDKNGTVEYR